MPRFFAWLDDKNTREKIGFVAAGFGAVIAAGWAVFTFVVKERPNEVKSPVPQHQVTPVPTPSQSSAPLPERVIATHLICRGFFETSCPAHDEFVGCDKSLSDWAWQRCGTYTIKTLTRRDGDVCGYHVAEVSCTAK
jgi:hypothetical protein